MRSLLNFNARLATRRVLARAARRGLAGMLVGFASGGLLSLSGCAAFRPVEGIPARYVPDEVKAPSRSGKKTIDLSLLSQTQPSVYRLDAGDVLAIYIEGVIPRPNELPPVNMPHQGEEATPALGYPIPVRPDGMISLPSLSKGLPVRGLTIQQAEEAVRRAYTIDKRFLNADNNRVWVILHKPRQYRVLVIRQEGADAATAGGQPGQVNLGALKRGTGRAVTLSAYKNDVLHALAETGGLPGLDAENTIYVIRSKRRAAGAASPNSWANPLPPGTGWSVGSPSPGTLPPLISPALPAPADGHSVIPQPSAATPAVPNSNANPPAETPSEPVSPADPNAGAKDADAAEPQTRGRPTSANSRIQPAVLGFEAAESPRRVTPIAFNQPAIPSVIPPAPAWPPGMVPMTAPTVDAAGLPPIHSGEHWPEMSADAWLGHSSLDDPTLANHNVIKIPVRLAAGEQIQFTERDIILEDGDIVFIESRDTEIFYTGGLLGGGQYTLPRDYDLDVLGAIAIAQAGRAGGGSPRATGGVTALNQDVTISASQAVILRRMSNGTQVPIKVDLYRAVRNPAERVLMQPGDYLILQYTRMEACGAFIERHLLEGALFGVAAAQVNSNR